MMKYKKIHLVGIGGVGMGGLAEILYLKGYNVTGSDLFENSITSRLVKLGIRVYFKHSESNIFSADILVISTAIPKNNPEVLMAYKKNIPILHRAEMLQNIMKLSYNIIISGTHGKTTTTSLLSSIYIESGLNPTIVNGGYMNFLNSYVNLGFNEYFILEGDESDASFLFLDPNVIIITNIDTDHLNNYNYDFSILINTFINFLYKLPSYGYAVVCNDNPIINDSIMNVNRTIKTYGMNCNSDYCLMNYIQYNMKSYFDVLRKNKPMLSIILNVPGIHNALNAVAAIAIATEEGISDKDIINALLYFKGTKNRFEMKGSYQLSKVNSKNSGNIIIIEDYGHHPTEIQASIDTIRREYLNKRLVLVYQPHRYTRIKYLLNNFIKVLSTVDVLFILNIYSAGEIPIKGINSYNLCKEINKFTNVKPFLIKNRNVFFKLLSKVLKDNDVILMQGAGDIEKLTEILIKKYFL